MPAPSYHLTAYTGTTDPAGDIIALVEVDLTAAGWEFVEQAAYTQTATPRYMRVWKCPAAQNKAGVDFHIGLVKSQVAGTYIAARAFEGYNSTTHTIQRPCVAGISGTIPMGVSWGTRAMATSQASASVSSAGGTLFVGPNTAGVNVNSTADGFTWVTRVMPSSQAWRTVAYGNGTWVAGSSTSGTALAYSTNGSTWLATNALPSATTWVYPAFGNGSLGNMFVAISSAAASQLAASSPDGITWTARTMPVAGTWGPVRFGNGMFVALNRTASSTNVATSPDGQTWTNRPGALPSGTWGAIEFGGGIFLAVGSTGVAATSTDGITWTPRGVPAAYDFVAYGNGQFMVTNAAGTAVATSPDGITWTARPPTPSNPSGIGFNNGFFYYTQAASTNLIYFSSMDAALPYHGGSYDFPLENSLPNYPAHAELLPTTVLAASTNYDVGVLASRSYLVINVQPVGSTSMRLCWLLGLFDPVYPDSQATYPPLAAVDLREGTGGGPSGVSRSPRVTTGGNAFTAVVGGESLQLGNFVGAVAEPVSGQLRASRVALGGTGQGAGFTGPGAAFRGRLYDVVGVPTGNVATALKVADSITIGSTVYTALGSSGTNQNFVTGSAGWFFDTAAGS